MSKKLTLFIFVLIVMLAGMMMVSFLTHNMDWGADYAGFIMQAVSIVEGNPREYLEANRFIIEQSSEPMGPVAYPWGYPLLLAPIYSIFGVNYLAFKSVAAIFYLLFLAAMWIVFREDHPPFWFLLLVSLFAFNTRMLEYTNSIFSDLPFLLVSTISIWMIRRNIVQLKQVFSPILDPIFTGLLITAAFLLRTNGVLLLATLGFSQIIAGRIKKSDRQLNLADSAEEHRVDQDRKSLKHILVEFSPYIVFILSVMIWRSFLPEGGTSHLSYLSNITLDSITSNSVIYAETSLEFFKGAPVPFLFFGASIALTIAGAFSRYRSDYPTILYVLMTLGLYILWPYNIRFRFLFPILPFCFSFAFTALDDFTDGSNKIEKAIRKVVVYGPVLLVILFFLINNLQTMADRMRGTKGDINSGPYAPASQEMFSYIENQTEPDSVIVFMKPRLLHMLTGRLSIRIINVEELSRGDYLVFYLGEDFRRSYQISEKEAERLEEKGTIKIVYENQDFIIYRLGSD